MVLVMARVVMVYVIPVIVVGLVKIVQFNVRVDMTILVMEMVIVMMEHLETVCVLVPNIITHRIVQMVLVIVIQIMEIHVLMGM